MVNDLSGLTPSQLKQLETAEKLFRVAGRNPTEAAAFTARAMAILEDLNLDMSVLEQGDGSKAKRADEKMVGGLYKWQRELWEAIAQLHFCYYWNQYSFDKTKVNKYRSRKNGERVMGGYKFQHRLVGKVVNIVASRNMAQYLEQTIERLTREHVVDPANYWTRYATSYRQGIAEEVVGKILARREDMVADEARKQREAEERATQASMAGASTSRAVTIASLVASEEQANYDFLHGEGAWAKREADQLRYQQRAAERRAKREAEWTAYKAAHPKEAAKAEEEARKARRHRTPWNYGMRSEKDTRDWSAYRAGRETGKNVGIEPQADQARSAGAIS